MPLQSQSANSWLLGILAANRINAAAGLADIQLPHHFFLGPASILRHFFWPLLTMLPGWEEK